MARRLKLFFARARANRLLEYASFRAESGERKCACTSYRKQWFVTPFLLDNAARTCLNLWW